MPEPSHPLVAIVGRPNVGKSTLFNRLIGKRKSLVESEPGVTRDRIYAQGEWAGRPFSLVDTGGLIPGDSGGIIGLVRKQVEMAIEEADTILFLVDIREGLTPLDEEIARQLRQIDKPVILAANKADKAQGEAEVSDFYRLGLSQPIPVSASHGLNINELLDKVFETLPLEGKVVQEGGIKVAVVGRPNVGKSSFINALLQEERLIVDEKPGTTRDAIDTAFQMDGERFIFVDTAGMRPRSKVKRGVESYSIIRALRSIERCDIALLLADAREGITSQDCKIANYICREGRGCIIAVNKWDLLAEIIHPVDAPGLKVERHKNRATFAVEKEKAEEEYRKIIREKLKFLSFAPLIFISALTGERVFEVIYLIRMAARSGATRPAPGTLRRVFEEAIAHYRPPGGQAKSVTLYRLRQVGIKPPTFVLFANHPQFITEPYLHYLNNRLRQAFGFEGTPLKIIPRKGR